MDKTLEMNFGKRVETLLEERQIKPTDFYASIKLIPQNFYDWKNKGTIPNAATAYKIAQYFGVSIEYLLTGKQDNPLQAKVEELQERLKTIASFINDITANP